LSGPEELAAGSFSSWMTEMQAAIRGEAGSDVPCGGCTACCTSSQFVHISPDETETLAHIAPELLFPAPRRPSGHVVLGFDERGHCPMLIDDHCSIYDHRPRTCRTYDCRVFPAAGIDADTDDHDKARIGRQARRWRFSYPSVADQTEHDAVRAAAAFLDDHRGRLPAWPIPSDATQLAVLAIEIHDLFLGVEEISNPGSNPAVIVRPDPESVRVELTRRIGGRGTTAGH
jgi:Fe-S-cluster containining protein